MITNRSSIDTINGITIASGDVEVKSIAATNGVTIDSAGLKISTGLTVTSTGDMTIAGSFTGPHRHHNPIPIISLSVCVFVHLLISL